MGTSSAGVPLVLNNTDSNLATVSNSWKTGLQVYTLDNSRITVQYVRDQNCTAGRAPFANFTWDPGHDTAAGTSENFFLPSYPGIPNGWYGYAYVKATNNARTFTSVSMTTFRWNGRLLWWGGSLNGSWKARPEPRLGDSVRRIAASMWGADNS